MSSNDFTNKEITLNYLRALAVLSVLVYHYFPILMSRGYLGVDIFFVLSGYLIRKQIAELALTFGEISLEFKFYLLYRLRRILPSFLFILIVIYILGWYLFPSDEFLKLSRSLLDSGFFVSNISLANEVDYFNNSSSYKPALHLWSLSVEVQFYLLAFALYRFFNIQFCFLLAITSLSSYYLIDNETIAFYYLPFRIWEFMFGAIIFYIAERYKSFVIVNATFFKIFALICAFLLIAVLAGSLFNIKNSNLIVCILSVLLIFSLSNEFFTFNYINILVNFFSNNSYAIYLWHWPLYVYGLIYFGESFNSSYKMVGVLASIFLGYLTTISLEISSRSYFINLKRLTILSVISFTISGLFIFTIYAEGFSSRDIEVKGRPILSIKRAMASPGIEFVNGEIINPRIFKGESDRAVVFMGSSLMSQYYGRVIDLYGRKEMPKLSAVYVSRNHCTPISTYQFITPENYDCMDFYKSAAKFALSSSTKTVVLAASWPSLYNSDLSFNELGLGLINDIKNFKSHGKSVVIISNPPHFGGFDPFSIFAYYRLNNFSNTELRVARERIEVPELKAQLIKIAQITGASIIDPFDYLCDEYYCQYTRNGIPLYVDEAHISYDFGAQSALFIDKLINDKR